MLPDGWASETIESLRTSGAIIGHQDGNHGSLYPRVHEFGPEGVPFLTAKSLSNGRIDIEGSPRLPDDRADQLRIGFTQTGDVLLAHNATVGRVAVVPEFQGRLLLGTSLTYFRVNPARLSPQYLAAYLTSPAFQKQLEAVMNQTTRNQVPITTQRFLRIVVPPLPTQRRIAAILSAYDNLIENNTRRIAILEEMARRLYEEWFVRFRFPGHEKAKMVESEAGLVPMDWEATTVGSVAKVNARAIVKKDAPTEITYVAIDDVSPGRINAWLTMAFADAPSRARRRVQHGDVIWSSVRPNRRSFALVLNPSPDLIVSTGFAVLTPTGVPFSYLYAAITTDDFTQYLVNHATGAAYPAVNAADFEAGKIIVPPSDLLALYHRAAEPALLLADALDRENRALRSSRDLLLPKLISGELDVSKAEAKAETQLAEATA